MWQAIKAVGSAVANVIAAAPVSAIIKGAVGLGIAVFTAYVLIKRTKKMHKDSHDDTHAHYSPVDEILHNNYVADVDAFDDMDPEAREICKKLNKDWKKRKKKKGVRIYHKKSRDEDKARVVSLFDDNFDLEKEDDEPLIREHVFYHSADEMLNAKKRRRASKKAKDVMKSQRTRENMSKLASEWKEYGRATKDLANDTLLRVAKELGLTVEDDPDADLDDSIREQAPSLF